MPLKHLCYIHPHKNSNKNPYNYQKNNVLNKMNKLRLIIIRAEEIWIPLLCTELIIFCFQKILAFYCNFLDAKTFKYILNGLGMPQRLLKKM